MKRRGGSTVLDYEWKINEIGTEVRSEGVGVRVLKGGGGTFSFDTAEEGNWGYNQTVGGGRRGYRRQRRALWQEMTGWFYSG